MPVQTVDPSNRHVKVCLTPALIDQVDVKDYIVVVIDVLRATTSMCVAFDHGVRTMVPVLNVEDCDPYREKGYLAAAERNGVQLEGFHFGNSPFSFMDPNLKGKDIVITTTNGTKAIHASLEAKEIVIGSFANISVLTDYLIKRNENILLLCSGWKDRMNLEDTIFAGAMVKKLRSRFQPFEDTALIAETVFKAANRRKRYFMRNSSHFLRLIHLKIQKDVKYALRRDTHPVIPIYFEGMLVNLKDLPKFRREHQKSEKDQSRSEKLSK